MVCNEHRVSRIAGGFVLIEVPALMAAWRACQSRPLGSGDFRTWLACHEMKARRCQSVEGRTPSYSSLELARLLGVSERRARASVKRLAVAGLVDFREERISFPDQILETEQLGETIGGGRGSVAVPRRMLRHLASGARPALIATVFGTLLRCLSRRRGGFDGRGRVKAGWIARTFGVDVRRVKAARAELVTIGWIEPEPGNQRIENRYGRAFRIDLSWSRSEGSRLPPLEPIGRPPIATPSEDREPLRESKNQEPAERGPAGFQKQDSGKGEGIKPPNLDDVQPRDLRDAGRMLELHRQAVERNLISPSEADRLRVLTIAEHAAAIGTRNPAGLFVRLLTARLWHFATADDEIVSTRRLKAIYGRPIKRQQWLPILRPPGLSPMMPGSSER